MQEGISNRKQGFQRRLPGNEIVGKSERVPPASNPASAISTPTCSDSLSAMTTDSIIGFQSNQVLKVGMSSIEDEKRDVILLGGMKKVCTLSFEHCPSCCSIELTAQHLIPPKPQAI